MIGTNKIVHKFSFDSLDDLAACEEIDAVYIASPNYCHAAQAIQMLKNGKHVLCEKPIVSNSSSSYGSMVWKTGDRVKQQPEACEWS